MRTLTDACEQIVERIERGLDAVVGGEAEALRAAMLSATARLQETHGVVTVAGPGAGPGEGASLSLSSLIAQLSGRGNLDDHDDSVLELGVRRLIEAAIPGQRTVLVLNAPAGVQRSAFRFLRQVSRRVPDLIYVVAEFAELATLLAEPGMETLSARFAAASVPAWAPAEVVDAPEPRTEGAPAMLPVAASVMVPPEWRDLRASPLSAGDADRRRRRAMLWTASAVGMVASVTLGAWLGARMETPVAPAPAMHAYEASGISRRPALAMALTPAQVAVPAVVASAPPPMAGVVPAPSLAGLPGADLARSARPEIATATTPGVEMAYSGAYSGALSGALSGAPSEASLAQDPRELSPGHDEGVGETAMTGVPHEAVGAKPRALARPVRSAAVEAPTRLAPDEHRRMSPRPQRLAALPQERRSRWAQEESSSEDMRREMRPYAADPERLDENNTPPVRYRRYTPPEPVWRGERAVPSAEGPYIGTYEPGPYGGRVFRYEP